MRDGIERPIVRVPIELLRYRKDNGRIASDVADYECNVGLISEKMRRGRKSSRDSKEKDPEKTAILRSSMIHGGQLEPAIVTADGFLINGNRRKMVMDLLHDEKPNDETSPT